MHHLDTACRTWLRHGAFAGMVALGMAAAAPADAASSFAADASGLLTIAGIASSGEAAISDLIVTGSAALVDSEALGGAVFSGTVDFFGDGLDQAAAVSGTVAPPPGSASALYFTDGLLSLENTSSTDTFTVDFTFDYGLSASASVDDPTLEDAFATSTVLLSSALAIIVDETITADTVFGEPGGTLGDAITFSVTIAPAELEELFLTVDAEGAAVSAVPVPAALPLLASAFGILGVLGLRRRQTS